MNIMASNSDVSLNNYKQLDNYVVNHSLVLLEGEVPKAYSTHDPRHHKYINPETGSLDIGEGKGEQIIKNLESLHMLVNHGGLCQKWPVVEGEFKAFVKLNLGENDIEIVSPELGSRQRLKLKRIKPENQKRFVRVVYIKCLDSDGKFDAPENTKNDLDTAIRKLQFNALLLQSFVAVDMCKHGFGFQTFQLEEDASGDVVVHVFESKLMTEKAHSMSGSQLYSWFYKELNHSPLYDPNCKFLAFMSCTHYDPPQDMDTKHASRYVKAHTALGGGDLGLFGTGGLHTWASGIEDIVHCFTDETKIDKTKLFDDSCGRGTYWANYSTTLGAAMHELGHCFDLSHTPDGIMARGFDDMHLFATISQSRCKTQSPQSPASSVNDGNARADMVLDDGRSPRGGEELVQDGAEGINDSGDDAGQSTTEIQQDGQVTMLMEGPHNGSETTPDAASLGTLARLDSESHTTSSNTQFTSTEVHHQHHAIQASYTSSSTTATTDAEVMVRHSHSASEITMAKTVYGSQCTSVSQMVAQHGSHHQKTQQHTTATSYTAFSTSLTRVVTTDGDGDGSRTTDDGGDSCTQLSTMIQVPRSTHHDHNAGNAVTTITEVPCAGIVQYADEVAKAVHDDNTSTNKMDNIDATKNYETSTELVEAGTSLSTGIFADHRAHWHRSSAVVLHYHKWFNEPPYQTESNEPVLQVNWSPCVKGPVGNGGGGQKHQTFFDDVDWCRKHDLVIAGYAVYHSKYINAIEPIYTSDCKVKDSPTHGKADNKYSMSTFLMEDGEYLTNVELYAGAWVDGIRFHTNLKSSEWFGGKGGNWSQLKPNNGGRIVGMFGTFGDYLGCLGIHLDNRTHFEKKVTEKSLEIESSLGIRLVELRKGDEMVKFWEFVGKNPPTLFDVPSTSWKKFEENLDECSIFVFDDGGNVCVTGLHGFSEFCVKVEEINSEK